jgi:hypothetical protein
MAEVLDAFVELRKASVSFITSVRTHRTTRLPSDEFLNTFYLCIFRRSVDKNQFPLASDKNNECFAWRQVYVYNRISLNSGEFLRQIL